MRYMIYDRLARKVGGVSRDVGARGQGGGWGLRVDPTFGRVFRVSVEIWNIHGVSGCE